MKLVKWTSGFIPFLLLLNSATIAQEEVSITNVSVWVKVTNSKGEPVLSLKATDFKVYENGKEVNLTCFEEIGSSLTQTAQQDEKHDPQLPTTPQPFLTTRKAVLFLDLYNTSMAEYRGITKHVRGFLNQIQGGQWSVMLAVLTKAGRAGVVVPFTIDSNKVTSALRQQEPNAHRDIAVMNRKREISRLLELYPSRDTIEKAYSLASQFAKQEKIDAERSLAAFPALGDYLEKIVQGDHVSVIFVSGGINVEPGRQYYEIVNKIVERSGLSANATELALQMPLSSREPNFDLRNEIKKSIGILSRENITVYCINARGTMNPGFDHIGESNPDFIVNDQLLLGDFQETLDQVASETGGLSFKNSNNFSLGFDIVIKDSDHQYILCYNAPERKKNQYREIKVVSLRPGINLRYRRGYVP